MSIVALPRVQARGLAVLQQEPAPSDNVSESSLALPKQGEGTRVGADHRRWYKSNQSSRIVLSERKPLPDEQVNTPRTEDAIHELENSLLTKPEKVVVTTMSTYSAIEEDHDSVNDCAILDATASTVENHAELEASSLVAKVPHVESGTVTIVHSIKRKEFAVSCPPGAVAVAELDDRFCFPFAFKPGTYTIRLRTTDPNVTDDPGDLLHPQLPLTSASSSLAENSALITSVTEEPTIRVLDSSNENDGDSSSVYCTTDEEDALESDPRVILGVKLGCTYWCDIEEHESGPDNCGKETTSKRIFKADPDQREPTRTANPDKVLFLACANGSCFISPNCHVSPAYQRHLH